MTVPITARIDAGFERLAELEPEWRDLFGRTAAEPAMSFEWTDALVRTQVEPTDACYLVELRRDERLVGVVPLIARASRVFRQRHVILRPVAELKNKESHGTSLTANPKQGSMFRELGRAMATAGHLHLHLLWLNGEPIAHNLGYVHRGTYYYLKTSYAGRYRPQSPATYLRLSLIDKMISRGLKTFDFCGTPYEWERQWTDTYRWHHVLSIYANNWRGRLWGLVDRWSHQSSSGRTVEHADPHAEGPES